jgi:hypothetical protein
MEPNLSLGEVEDSRQFHGKIRVTPEHKSLIVACGRLNHRVQQLVKQNADLEAMVAGLRDQLRTEQESRSLIESRIGLGAVDTVKHRQSLIEEVATYDKQLKISAACIKKLEEAADQSWAWGQFRDQAWREAAQKSTTIAEKALAAFPKTATKSENGSIKWQLTRYSELQDKFLRLALQYSTSKFVKAGDLGPPEDFTISPRMKPRDLQEAQSHSRDGLAFDVPEPPFHEFPPGDEEPFGSLSPNSEFQRISSDDSLRHIQQKDTLVSPAFSLQHIQKSDAFVSPAFSLQRIQQSNESVSPAISMQQVQENDSFVSPAFSLQHTQGSDTFVSPTYSVQHIQENDSFLSSAHSLQQIQESDSFVSPAFSVQQGQQSDTFASPAYSPHQVPEQKEWSKEDFQLYGSDSDVDIRSYNRPEQSKIQSAVMGDVIG